tara:strand:- start:3792 stop:4346 length:555 start_codon:yes stop_codon:yes gene_type:complete
MIDKTISFIPVNVCIITVSDTRTLENDKSGDLLKRRIIEAGHNFYDRMIVEDDKNKISILLENLSLEKKIDVIITTGGTGLTGRDVTPEAVQNLFDKPIEGFGEMFRWISYKKIGTSALQSRSTAGVKNGKYIFCLPGSPSACKDAWDEILLYQLDIRHKPCNFIEIIPRLKENALYRQKNKRT